MIDEIEAPADADEIEDLADIALAHRVKHVRLDLSRIDVREVLSVGDVADMAAALDADPAKLGAVLARGEGVALDVAVVLAWIIGRKGDPDLQLDDVRRFWQIELVGIGTAKPNPAVPARKITRSPVRAGSSRKRG